MSYQLATLDASLWDEITGSLKTAVSSAASSAGASAASGAAPELKKAVVGAVNEVLPNVANSLSSVMVSSLQPVILAFAVLSAITLGSVGVMFLQYRRLGKCCPTR